MAVLVIIAAGFIVKGDGLRFLPTRWEHYSPAHAR